MSSNRLFWNQLFVSERYALSEFANSLNVPVVDITEREESYQSGRIIEDNAAIAENIARPNGFRRMGDSGD